MRTTSLTLALTAALGFSAAAHADINFDRNGAAAGGAVVTDVFDWAPGNILFENAVVSGGGSTSFDLYGHCTLSAFLKGPVSQGGAIAGSEFTYTFHVPMFATAALPGFALLNAGAGGIFEIFYDDTAATQAQTITGTGYADGELILQGSFLPQIAAPGEGGFLAVITNPAAPPLDGFGPNDQAPITTDFVNGSTIFNIDATYADDDFFLTDVVSDSLAIGFDLDLSNLVLAAFTQTNPADIVGGVLGETSTFNAGTLQGATAGSVSPYDITPNFGGDLKNDNSCLVFPCDIQAQTDGSSKFTAQLVPAPAPLALLGIGLFGIGARAWSKRRTA